MSLLRSAYTYLSYLLDVLHSTWYIVAWNRHRKPIKTNLDDAVSKPRGVPLLICMLLCLAQVNLEVERNVLKRSARKGKKGR